MLDCKQNSDPENGFYALGKLCLNASGQHSERRGGEGRKEYDSIDRGGLKRNQNPIFNSDLKEKALEAK